MKLKKAWLTAVAAATVWGAAGCGEYRARRERVAHSRDRGSRHPGHVGKPDDPACGLGGRGDARGKARPHPLVGAGAFDEAQAIREGLRQHASHRLVARSQHHRDPFEDLDPGPQRPHDERLDAPLDFERRQPLVRPKPPRLPRREHQGGDFRFLRQGFPVRKGAAAPVSP